MPKYLVHDRRTFQSVPDSFDADEENIGESVVIEISEEVDNERTRLIETINTAQEELDELEDEMYQLALTQKNRFSKTEIINVNGTNVTVLYRNPEIPEGKNVAKITISKNSTRVYIPQILKEEVAKQFIQWAGTYRDKVFEKTQQTARMRFRGKNYLPNEPIEKFVFFVGKKNQTSFTFNKEGKLVNEPLD